MDPSPPRDAFGDCGQRGREIPPEVVDWLARVASSATELNEVAWYHAERRNPDEAMPFAERAVRLDPLCWTCLDTYALALFEKGRLDEAMKASDRAVSVLPEKVSAPYIDLLHRQIAQAVARSGGRGSSLDAGRETPRSTLPARPGLLHQLEEAVIIGAVGGRGPVHELLATPCFCSSFTR